MTEWKKEYLVLGSDHINRLIESDFMKLNLDDAKARATNILRNNKGCGCVFIFETIMVVEAQPTPVLFTEVKA
jgi:hypothetical protein